MEDSGSRLQINNRTVELAILDLILRPRIINSQPSRSFQLETYTFN